MRPRKEDMEHVNRGEGGTVPDGLYPRDISLSLLERICLGPKAQHRPLYGAGLPLQCPREGTHKVPRGAQVTSPTTTVRPHKVGWDLCGPTDSRAKTASTGDEEERVDIGGHVKTR